VIPGYTCWCRNNPGKSGYLNPESEVLLKTFKDATQSEMLCSKLSGQHFNTIQDHSDYIENGGCENLITTLAQA